MYTSVRKLSGNPADLPNQSRPDMSGKVRLSVEGPAGIGLFDPEDEETFDGYMASNEGALVPKGESVGNATGSWTFPTIQRCTNLMYLLAGTGIGWPPVFSQA